MLQDIKNLIKNKNVILFGEFHGTKEIPEMLSQFFSEMAKDENFNMCLEIPEEFQNLEPDKILSHAKEADTSGLISKEYIKLLKDIPRNIKVFFIAPNFIKNQEDVENGLANNILKILDDKKTFVILGNIHASKTPINLGNFKIITAGTILNQELKNKLFSINISPKKGKFYNFGVKEIKDSDDINFNKGFDYVLRIDRVSPCSLL